MDLWKVIVGAKVSNVAIRRCGESDVHTIINDLIAKDDVTVIATQRD